MTATPDDIAVAVSHAVDDLEIARTAAVRGIDRNLRLLDDALDALRAGDVHVTDEFLDRAIVSLRATLAQARAV